MRTKIALILIAAMICISGCAGNGEDVVAEDGDLVKVDYIGTLEDGSVFDTSIEEVAMENPDIYNTQRTYQPLEFTIGAGQMISGFDNGVRGMAAGETKTLELQPADAYGEHRDDLIRSIAIEEMEAANITPVVGQKLYTGYGQQITIIGVNETNVTLDYNHHLAGKNLNFEVTLISINETA